MGHAIHFLERVERLNLRQADRALGLYRDPQAVAFLLKRMRLPEGVDRVAVAVGAGENPGHVLLTRDGHFVTCLAPGMGIRDVHVVPFATMEHELNQLGTLREALNGQVTRGAALEKLKNLFHKSEAISREEFQSLRRLRPLLGDDLIQLNTQSWAELARFRQGWREPTRLRGSTLETRTLSLYWRALWAACHINTLLMTDYPELERILRGAPEAESAGMRFSWPLVRSGVRGLILRGWHAAGLQGAAFLPAVDLLMQDTLPVLEPMLCATGGLVAVGLRHPELRDEVRTLLDRVRHRMIPEGLSVAQAYEQARQLEGIKRLDMECNIDMGTFHDKVRAPYEATEAGSQEFERRRQALFEKNRKIFPHLHDVTDDFVAALPLYDPRTVRDDATSDCAYLGGSLRSAATLDPAGLYLPENLLRLIVDPTNKVNPEVVRAHLKAVRSRVPVVVPPRPGRNEPCTCGSGKKYKVCCGR